MLANLLPTGVAVSEATADPADAGLHPEELALVAHSVEKRQLEFGTVRWCARRAMEELGVEPGPVLPGRRGVPQWAPGVVGSMTHCAGYRAAALARAGQFTALGIDAEPDEPLPEGILESIALPEEMRWIRQLERAVPQVSWGRLLFSIKESVYKAWFPLTGQELDFPDASVTVDPASGRFRARLVPVGMVLSPAGPTVFEGRWAAGNGVLVSATWVPAPARNGEERPPRSAAGSAVSLCADPCG
ncbi:4'-phosphopantetheinyl transferase [Streptomyces spiralis]|uniref:4'-phosphopantetheinyl transferase n=1 Tax=Streptomyces spiralis TaxID=66376 RepID=A0A919A2H4_9ACTN|nr:4'-phosphopantetheinyl transferase superfamily protein [Streptomyces spiralis]GHE84079.1 4'-phosphopantetheinyl transferase [Streptomyces spiralis]